MNTIVFLRNKTYQIIRHLKFTNNSLETLCNEKFVKEDGLLPSKYNIPCKECIIKDINKRFKGAWEKLANL